MSSMPKPNPKAIDDECQGGKLLGVSYVWVGIDFFIQTRNNKME